MSMAMMVVVVVEGRDGGGSGDACGDTIYHCGSSGGPNNGGARGASDLDNDSGGLVEMVVQRWHEQH